MNARVVHDTTDPSVDGYRLLTWLVVPRPIAWVSTVSGEGVGNLAPHSFFTVASGNPPVVQFTSVGVKDTLRNVLATGEFVVNLATLDQLHFINNSAARFDHGIDEAGVLDIAMEPSEVVSPPRVADAPASIECRLLATHEVGDSTIVLGSVVSVSVRADVITDGHPDVRKLAPLSRLGGMEWGKPPEPFELPRPLRPEDVVAGH